MIVSYAVSDSEDEEIEPECGVSEVSKPVAVLSKNEESNTSTLPKTDNSLLPEKSAKNGASPSTFLNGVKHSSEQISLNEDETTSLPFTFSAQIEDMLSGLPPPKKKKVTISESFLSASSISASLTSLTKKSVSSKVDPSKQQSTNPKLSKSNATEVVDSDDSDAEISANAAGPQKDTKEQDSVEGFTSGLRFENALLKMLPKARTTVDLKKTQLMVPDSVKNKLKLVSQQKVPKPDVPKTSTEKIDDEESNDTSSASYFNFLDSSEVSASCGDISTRDYYNLQSGSNSSSHHFELTGIPDNAVENLSNEEYYRNVSTSNDNLSNPSLDQMNALSSLNTAEDLDPEVLQRLKGRRKDELIEIKDVNAQDQLQDVSIEITKGLSEEQDQPSEFSESRRDKSDPNQRRAKSKHQINWLVSQAKSREVALKNQWANNRMNRKATQMKYGF